MADDWLEAAQTARRLQRRDHHSDGVLKTRATHRADPQDASLPPLFACREDDLMISLRRRGDAPHTILVHAEKTGWRAWRAYP